MTKTKTRKPSQSEPASTPAQRLVMHFDVYDDRRSNIPDALLKRHGACDQQIRAVRKGQRLTVQFADLESRAHACRALANWGKLYLK